MILNSGRIRKINNKLPFLFIADQKMNFLYNFDLSEAEKIPDYLGDSVLLVDFWGNWSNYRNSKSKKYLKVGEFIV